MDTFSKIAAYLAGTCSHQEKIELEAWRKEKPANEQDFRKLEKVWNSAAQPPCFMPDMEKAWQKVNARISSKKQGWKATKQGAGAQKQGLNVQKEGLKIHRPNEIITEPNPEAQPGKQPQTDPGEGQEKSRHSISSGASVWGMAAAVALLLLGAMAFFLLKQQDPASAHFSDVADLTALPGFTSLQTAAGEKQQLLLADGTQVWLNKNSHLHYPQSFGDSLREVHLQGEAYFEVAPDPEKAFIIHAGKGMVKVLGTAFNLQNRADVRLQVLSGSVEMRAKEKKEDGSGKEASGLLLKAGEAATLKGSKLQLSKPDLNVLAWKSGRFIFKDSSLKEVFKALESYYPVKFQAAQEPEAGLLQCRLFADFDRETIEEVLQVMSLTLNIQFEVQEPEQARGAAKERSQAAARPEAKREAQRESQPSPTPKIIVFSAAGKGCEPLN